MAVRIVKDWRSALSNDRKQCTRVIVEGIENFLRTRGFKPREAGPRVVGFVRDLGWKLDAVRLVIGRSEASFSIFLEVYLPSGGPDEFLAADLVDGVNLSSLSRREKVSYKLPMIRWPTSCRKTCDKVLEDIEKHQEWFSKLYGSPEDTCSRLGKGLTTWGSPKTPAVARLISRLE